MSSFLDDYLKKNISKYYTHDIVKLCTKIHEYKGKEQMYKFQSPQVIQKLQEIAMIQSTESSTRIEGIYVKNQRLQKLVLEKTDPKNRSENEVAGYRKVLSTIHDSFEHITISSNVIKQLHGIMYSFSPGEGGKYKMSDNSITQKINGQEFLRFTPTSAILTDQAMNDICLKYNEHVNENFPTDLILIAVFVLDFLCIHPFRDGNGRMARILTLLLLYKSGFTVGRYISIEKIIEDNKEGYYDTLYESSQEWHEGNHNINPWIEYLLGVIISAYRELENRVGNIKEQHGSKNERIRNVITGIIGEFMVSSIEEKCPGISRPTINGVLAKMREEGKIECTQTGRYAKWKVIN